VDERRRSVGIGPLAEDIRRRREDMARSNEQPPSDRVERRRQMEAWARSVGWRP
jgi:predicted nucleic acid-binding Zn ribbon protein